MCSLAFVTIELIGEHFGGAVDKTLVLLLQEFLQLCQHELAISFVIVLIADDCNRKPGDIVEEERIDLLLGLQSLHLPLLGILVFWSPGADLGEIVDGMCGHGDLEGGDWVASDPGLEWVKLQVRLEVAELRLQVEQPGYVELNPVLYVVGTVVFFHGGC
jgi:hypothetical protein